MPFSWAVGAAGLPESTTPYTLRHSGLSWALAAGIPATDVARYGGTSLAMLERPITTCSCRARRARGHAWTSSWPPARRLHPKREAHYDLHDDRGQCHQV